MPAWDVSSLNDPIKIRHANKTEYKFELFQKYNKKPIKVWTVVATSKSENSSLKPKLVYVSERATNPATDSLEIRPSSTAAAQKFRLDTILMSKAVGFIEPGIDRVGLESIDLPPGLRNLKDWSKEWIDLSQRASRLKIKLER